MENERLSSNQQRYDCDKLKKEISQLNEQLNDLTQQNDKLQQELTKESAEKIRIQSLLVDEKEKVRKREFDIMELNANIKSIEEEHPPCQHILYIKANENNTDEEKPRISQLYSGKEMNNNQDPDSAIYYLCNNCYDLYYLKHQYAKYLVYNYYINIENIA